jgi:hypothetical protein
MNMEPPTPPDPVCDIKCNVNKSAKKDWDCCDLKQYCAKIDSVNELQQRGKLTTDPSKLESRNASRGEGLFRKKWNEAPLAWQPYQHKFYHPCAAKKASENDYQMNSEDWNPDHVHDIQLGGAATNFKNLKWLSQTVNMSIGPSMSAFDPNVHTGGISADCCPAEETHCAGKEDTDNILS